MKLCIYTNFGALFSTVDVDFGFFAHIKIFEIAKFVYWTKLTSFLQFLDGLQQASKIDNLQQA